MCKATAFLDSLTAIINIPNYPDSVPVALRPAAALLAHRGYDSGPIQRAIEHLERFGSAAGCEAIEDEDREAVEGLLLEVECHDDCKPCRDEAEWRRGLL